MSQREPFAGSRRKLVLAIDIGTTYSGISFSVLDPGAVPEIKGVTRFPAQPPGGASKIPSVLYYDAAGVVRAVGAETLLASIVDQAEDELWFKVEWFKLHLRPKSDTSHHITKQIPALPPNKSLVEVYADFIQYLYSCAKSFIQETLLPDGVGFWASVEASGIDFVLSHPNGWEGQQQRSMRYAAVLAGLVSSDPDDQDRIRFVTEGEASLHFCVNSGLTIRENEGIIIVDAGGGTIDLSAYSSESGRNYQEISRPECCFAGSIFVTEESRAYFEERLRESRFHGDVPRITESFDQTTKLQFRNSDEPSYVKFGGVRDREPALDIRSGQMKISGVDVARFFEPSISAILKAVIKQRSTSRRPITAVFLVGGFAASPWLFSKLQEKLQQLGLSVHRPDTHVNKAVSDGAVSFFLDHFVTSRVSRSAFGIEGSIRFKHNNPEHRRRGHYVESTSGDLLVDKAFCVILRKDVQVSEEQEFRAPFFRNASAPLKSISIDILTYRGVDEDPCWIDVESEMYSIACTVTANASQISAIFSRDPQKDLTYYKTNFDVILLFGLTELKAQIAWKENGVEKRGPAQVVYGQL